MVLPNVDFAQMSRMPASSDNYLQDRWTAQSNCRARATTEIARHRTIKEVQYMLWHRSLLSIDYFVQLVTFESDDYTSANDRTIQEAQKLVEAGFEYVCDFDEDKLFRKRK